MKQLNAVTATLLIIFFTSCIRVDDQRLANDEMQKVINPLPAYFSKKINQGHQILIGIVDSGIDYNHPLLVNNIHYKLDESGLPVGLGHDFVGMDNWPAPYLAMTAGLYERASQLTVVDQKNMQKGIAQILTARPDFSKFLNLKRDHEKEGEVAIDHGTHVAGLASYDNDQIGILPYRVFPHQYWWTKNYPNVQFFDLIISGLNMAISDGAKIINLSMGKSFMRDAKDIEIEMQEYAQVENFVKAHPDILFVAAAGNDGEWLDAKNKFGYPCGINASNMLCVASLNDQMDISTFTNIPLNDTALIFALGENVISTVPTAFCPAVVGKEIIEIGNEERGDAQSRSYKLNKLVIKLDNECIKKDTSLQKKSGTSMASPLIAHVLAEIWLKNKNLEASDILKKLFEQSTPSSIGKFPIQKFSIKKPSWYKRFYPENKRRNAKNKEEDAFDFILIN